MTMKQFKRALRENDYKYDKWATAMSAFFALSALMYVKGYKIPTEWQYKAGMACPIDKENSFHSVFCRLGEKKLLAYGQYLHRLTGILDKAGLSY